jgi:tRNA (adenine57-N1/adenine58-N1)-methyltransferase catalytic subunit
MAAVQRILVCDGKKFYVKDTTQDFHTQYGYVSKKDLLAPSGSIVFSNTKKEFMIIDAFFIDKYDKLSRAPQIVPRKDIGLFIVECGINKESIVIDAGTGSGAVTCFLAGITKEVHTLEAREDHHRVAMKNIEIFGFKNVHAKIGSIYESVPVTEADAFFLDVPEPWNAIETAAKALKSGGFLCSYSPCIPQVSDFVEAIKADARFTILKTIELSEREWEVAGRKIRPKSTTIGHSGFLTFVRKIVDAENKERIQEESKKKQEENPAQESEEEKEKKQREDKTSSRRRRRTE